MLLYLLIRKNVYKQVINLHIEIERKLDGPFFCAFWVLQSEFCRLFLNEITTFFICHVMHIKKPMNLYNLS